MVPNTMGVILVTLTFAVPSAIFAEAFLSFIGMGIYYRVLPAEDAVAAEARIMAAASGW